VDHPTAGYTHEYYPCLSVHTLEHDKCRKMCPKGKHHNHNLGTGAYAPQQLLRNISHGSQRKPGQTWEILTIHADGDTAQTMRNMSLVLVDKRLVDPSYSAATRLQHLEELRGQHGLQPAEHLQLLQPPAGCSQRQLKPFYGDP